MWLWVKPRDEFGQSLLRTVRWLCLTVALIAGIAGIALGALWAAISAAFTPIVRF